MSSIPWKPTIWILLALPWISCTGGGIPAQRPREGALPAVNLSKEFEDNVGAPHIEQVTPRIFDAVGYDLANVILVHTPEGNVIVDTAMSPARAKVIKDALLARAPGPVKAIVYTHSHIDHVGGASAWADAETPIWATAAFEKNFLKQYGLFAPAEQRRGRLQFGEHAPPAALPCSSIGRSADIEAAQRTGALMPNHTFTGRTSLTVGGVEFDLIEAHGETADTLVVWIPSEKTLLCGDDFYRAFPNLYTIRGTTPRPVDQWIASLDAMRALSPEHLVPSHTRPLSGADEVRRALTDYRDAIEWVRDETVRGANAGRTVDDLAEHIHLPDHLARSPNLKETYGQVDWSVRAIYDNNLGWFDGRPETLYPLPSGDLARKEIAMMGGAETVLDAARQARDRGDVRWAIYLFSQLERSGLLLGGRATALPKDLALAYEKLAEGVDNTNGRGYLLESAYLLTHIPPQPPRTAVSDELLDRIPLATFFSIMAVRLIPEKSAEVEESMRVIFPREKTQFTITVRRGVAEIVEGDPLPGTPEPTAILTTDGPTWRRISVNRMLPIRAYAAGRLTIKGSPFRVIDFFDLFRRGI